MVVVAFGVFGNLFGGHMQAAKQCRDQPHQTGLGCQGVGSHDVDLPLALALGKEGMRASQTGGRMNFEILGHY